jgi:hypothetical protein
MNTDKNYHPGFSKKINEFTVKAHSDLVPNFNYKIMKWIFPLNMDF